jgi:prepilin-type N-terminal cleavage/methylation domain-containing protein
MNSRERNIDNAARGYSLVEMLIVTALIVILATIPVALLRRSREKTYEAEALKALRMMALAYENYYALKGHHYPNFRSDGRYADDIEYQNAEQIWDDLVRSSLLPRQYSGFPHDRRDLLARGYQLSIYPADYGAAPGAGARNTYAMAMIPYEGSLARQAIVVVQGQRFFTIYPSAIPRKMGALGLYSLTVYSMAE